jgi:hypothetical protein
MGTHVDPERGPHGEILIGPLHPGVLREDREGEAAEEQVNILLKGDLTTGDFVAHGEPTS